MSPPAERLEREPSLPVGKFAEVFLGAKPKDQVVDVTAALPAGYDIVGLPIASPWSTSHLEKLLVEDVFPGGIPPLNSRTSAMRLDPIARARNLLVTTISRMPLKLANVEGPLPHEEQPTWLYRTNVDSPRHRIVWTVDDLIFHGWSCWRRANSRETGFPLSVQRVDFGRWFVDADNLVNFRDDPRSPRDYQDEVLLIPGFHEGILSYGIETLSDARQLYGIVRDRLQNPTATTELHQTGGRQLTKPEQDSLVDSWRLARNTPGGTVGYTSKDIELKTHGADTESTLLIEGRNAAAVSCARIVGVAAGRIDATTPKASLNYETTAGINQEFIDMDLDLYMGPIEARLSLDDVVRRGERVMFDRTDETSPTPNPAGPPLED